MNQGEVWLVDFAPQVGEEIDKIRPAVIVSSNNVGNLRLKVVVPITSSSLDLDWMVKLAPTKANGLSRPSLVDCFQIKSLSQQRFVKQIGKLNDRELIGVKLGISKVLDLL